MRQLTTFLAVAAASTLIACGGTAEVPKDVDVDVQTDTVAMPDVDVNTRTDTVQMTVPKVDVDVNRDSVRTPPPQ